MATNGVPKSTRKAVDWHLRRAPRAMVPTPRSRGIFLRMPSTPHHPNHPGAARFRGSWAGLLLRATFRALVDPRLAIDLLRAGWAFRRRRWWSAPPFLPLPDATYLRWRMYTAYGSEDAVPPLEDLLRFVRWRRETMGL
jgi:hypothetical protein